MIKKICIVLLIFSSNGATMIIDDLNNNRANWSAISDNVMGGISEVNFREYKEDGKNFYRLEGTVSTKNNGGFIQSIARIPKSPDDYTGVRLQVRGSKDGYYVWIKTPTRGSRGLPWDRYVAYFEPSEQWTTIEIPFTEFKKSNFYMSKNINTSKIQTVALAAYGKDFEAMLDIAHLEFY